MKQCTAHSIQKVHHGVQRQTQELLTITHYRLVSFELRIKTLKKAESVPMQYSFSGGALDKIAIKYRIGKQGKRNTPKKRKRNSLNILKSNQILG